MKRWAAFAGIAGLVCAAYALLAAVVQRSFTGLFVLAQLAAALCLCAAWLAGGGLAGLQSAGGLLAARKTRLRAHCAFDAAIAAVLLIALNWLAYRCDWRWDTTEQKVFSLSAQSTSVLAALRQPVHLAVIEVPRVVDKERAEALLELYRRANPRISYEFIDPRRNPRRVERQLEMKAGDVLYVAYGEGAARTAARAPRVNEEEITNALLRLGRAQQKRIYYVLGHGEPRLDAEGDDGMSRFAAEIAGQHLALQGLLPAELKEVPDDAAAVVLASPQKPLLPAEREMLIRYVERGGGLLLLYDPLSGDDIPAIAARFGITVGRNVVLDRVQALQGGPEIGWQIIVRSYGYHPITAHLGENDPAVFLVAGTVRPAEAAKRLPDAQYSELAIDKSPTAWAETDLTALFNGQPQAVPGDADPRAPLPLAVAYERPVSKATGGAEDGRRSRLVVFGDSDWVRNAGLPLYANRDLALRCLDWTAGESALATIAPAHMRMTRELVLAQGFLMSIALSFLLPELILLAGLAVWWKRRTV